MMEITKDNTIKLTTAEMAEALREKYPEYKHRRSLKGFKSFLGKGPKRN